MRYVNIVDYTSKRELALPNIIYGILKMIQNPKCYQSPWIYPKIRSNLILNSISPTPNKSHACCAILPLISSTKLLRTFSKSTQTVTIHSRIAYLIAQILRLKIQILSKTFIKTLIIIDHNFTMPSISFSSHQQVMIYLQLKILYFIQNGFFHFHREWTR